MGEKVVYRGPNSEFEPLSLTSFDGCLCCLDQGLGTFLVQIVVFFSKLQLFNTEEPLFWIRLSQVLVLV